MQLKSRKTQVRAGSSLEAKDHAGERERFLATLRDRLDDPEAHAPTRAVIVGVLQRSPRRGRAGDLELGEKGLAALRRYLGRRDQLMSLGPDSFGVITSRCAGEITAQLIADRLARVVERDPGAFGEARLRTGWALATDGDAEALLEQADPREVPAGRGR